MAHPFPPEYLGRLVLIATAYNRNGIRIVLRQHTKGFSKTVFDTSTVPFKVLLHEEFLTTKKVDSHGKVN